MIQGINVQRTGHSITSPKTDNEKPDVVQCPVTNQVCSCFLAHSQHIPEIC